MGKIGIASDHAGFELKQSVKLFLKEKGLLVQDFGTNSEDSTDYPDYAHPLAFAVENSEVEWGIAICGSGIGMSIATNKHKGIRAALCWKKELAEVTRQHNNSNILVLPARFISKAEAFEMVEAFIKTPFEGGRHIKRVEKIQLPTSK